MRIQTKELADMTADFDLTAEIYTKSRELATTVASSGISATSWKSTIVVARFLVSKLLASRRGQDKQHFYKSAAHTVQFAIY